MRLTMGLETEILAQPPGRLVDFSTFCSLDLDRAIRLAERRDSRGKCSQLDAASRSHSQSWTNL